MNVRPRKKNKHLPPCVYEKHGAFWYVKKGKWIRLGKDLHDALKEYAHHVAKPEAGMESLIDKAWPLVIADKAKTTISQYEDAKGRIRKAFSEFRPDQVRPKDVAAFRDHYRRTPNMANRMVSVLRSIMHYAVDWQIIDDNPCVGVKRLYEAKRGRYLTDAEYEAIYEAASPSLRPLMQICYYTAQRIGDILSIRLSDVTSEGIRFTQQKTGTRVLIKMSPELEQAIADAKALPRPIRGMTLFCQRRGGRPYSYATVRDMWRTAVVKAGVEDARLHDLRAKALTDAKNQGKDAQALGGHSTEAMTNRYIRSRDTIVAEPPSFGQGRLILDKNQ